jgi:integrase/recombinase XerD
LPEKEGKHMTTLEKILKRLSRDVRPETVNVYTRHASDCPKRDDKDWKRCNCMKSLYVFQGGHDFRFSAKTRSWEKAEDLAREIKESLDPAKNELRKMKQAQQASRISLVDAVESYLADATKRGLQVETLRKLRTIFAKKLVEWAGENGLSYLDDCTTAQLTKWRNTWSLGLLASQKTQERVRSFFGFCVLQGWLAQNPASLLTRIKVPRKQTEYFFDEEFQKLVDTTYTLTTRKRSCEIAKPVRLRTLLLLMRWSGLRISDAVTLERSRLQGNNLLLRQMKTGTSVFVPLPPGVAEMLRNLPDGMHPNLRYFFWTGRGRPKSVVQNWSNEFRQLFEVAAIRNADGTRKRCHPHMLRHTFAVRNLESGMPLEEVSILMGHSSVKITEKHYAPWVIGRQRRLEESVRNALIIQGVLDGNRNQGGNEGSPAPAIPCIN